MADLILHLLAQRLGGCAEQPWPQGLARLASELAVFMMEGWQARFQGLCYGMNSTRENRVAWHEVTMDVSYWVEDAGRFDGSRGFLTDEVVVCWPGEPAELGRRQCREVLRRGIGAGPMDFGGGRQCAGGFGIGPPSAGPTLRSCWTACFCFL